MTNEEFSNEFDVLIGRYSLPGISGSQIVQQEFDEYEKSVFLTQAQETLVQQLYNGQISANGFEGTEQCRRFLNELIKTDTGSLITEDEDSALSPQSKIFKLPSGVMAITYEQITLDDDAGCHAGEIIPVIPTTQDQYAKIKNNPFRGPNSRRALRLDLEDNKVEVISNYPIYEYRIRYLAKPTPIILVKLQNGVTIEGLSNPTECTLNSALHKHILEAAVSLAIEHRKANSMTNKNNV